MIFADSLPQFKGVLAMAALPYHLFSHVICFVGAFILQPGTMSCTQAATVFQSRRRSVAALARVLAELRCSRDILTCFRIATLILEKELARQGDFLFILDGTKRHSQDPFLENSYSCGNSKRTPRQQRKGKGQRKQYKLKPRRCHSFIFGLLLTPGGLRLPYFRPYYTEEYAAQIDRPFRTDAQLAAEMILQLDLPADVRVIVVGDTAYDAKVIQEACAQRNFLWIVPANPERVLAAQPSTFRLDKPALAALSKAKVPASVLERLQGLVDKVFSQEEYQREVQNALSKEQWQQFGKLLMKHGRQKRRKVRALCDELSSRSFDAVRLSLDEGPYRLHRRLSASRGGPGKYPQRTYWVHRRTEDVHSVGMVTLLFSKKNRPSSAGVGQEKQKVDKILMSNAFEASKEELVSWYDLRWQIELFFKECKSVLGLADYRVGKFVQVEGWVQMCVLAFCYLEWYRAKQLLRTDLDRQERQRWQRARTHDLCQLVRQHLEQQEVEQMCKMMDSPEGRRQLKEKLRAAVNGAKSSATAA